MPDAHDRLLILAPHPDDESIATGALLQAARRAGAVCRVVVLTDGDNNPWPQRWVEKRWRIGVAERARWGARRREEARDAMRILGMSESEAYFLGLPDLGLTDLLMRADANVVGLLQAQIDEFAPSLLVLPALGDRHPDHSATNILARLALTQSRSDPPRLLEFAVHGDALRDGTVVVKANPQDRTTKHAAILAHVSQMRLSRRRFLRYATLPEIYRPATARADPQHVLRARVDGAAGSSFFLAIEGLKGGERGTVLFVVIEYGDGSHLRWMIRPDASAEGAQVRDCITGDVRRTALVRHSASEWAIALPDRPVSPRQGYVKRARPQPGWRVFDRYGWQIIEFPEQNSENP